MNITLNIDKELFNNSGVGDAIKEAFDSLSEENKVSIMKDIIHQYLSEESIIKKYFLNDRYDAWERKTVYYPSDNFNKIINKIDLSKDMEDIKDKMLNLLNNDLNKILSKLIADAYVNALSNMIKNDDDFRNDISCSIHSQFNMMMQANNNR